MSDTDRPFTTTVQYIRGLECKIPINLLSFRGDFWSYIGNGTNGDMFDRYFEHGYGHNESYRIDPSAKNFRELMEKGQWNLVIILPNMLDEIIGKTSPSFQDEFRSFIYTPETQRKYGFLEDHNIGQGIRILLRYDLIKNCHGKNMIDIQRMPLLGSGPVGFLW